MLRTDQRVARLYRRIEELEQWATVRSAPLADWRFNGQQLSMGSPWPSREGLVRLEHPQVSVPEGWALDQTRLLLDLGGEGLVRLHYSGGGHDTFGLDPNHRRYALKARAFTISAECVARLPFGVPNLDARLGGAKLVEIETELEDLILLLRQLAETAQELGAHDVVNPMLSAAEASLTELDWPSATPAYLARVASSPQMQRVWQLPSGLDPSPPGLDNAARQAVRAAQAALTEGLRRLKARYPQDGALALTGHAHIDLA